MTEYLNLDGGRIAYDDTGGTGPLVLAVPGIGDVRGLYRFLTPLLVDAGYRVITADLRGHGESSVRWPEYTPAAVGDDLVALLRALDAGPAFVLGESMAAASALWAAAEAPELVAGLVLLGPSARDHDLNLAQRLAMAAVGRSAALWTAYYRRLYPTRPPADLPEYVRALGANLRRPGGLAALRGLLAARKGAAEARIPEVTAPTLVVMGTRDADFPDPAAEAKLLTDRLSGELLMVEGAGHYPATEMPEVVAPPLLAFMARVRG